MQSIRKISLLAATLAIVMTSLESTAWAQRGGDATPVPSAKPVAATAPAADADKDDANPHLWKPRVTSVAVFKNGLGFFMREGDVKLRDGWCVAKEVPPASFGTLAIFSHDKDQTVDIVGSGPGEVVEFDGADAPKDIDAKTARIQACQDLSVQLTYKQGAANRTAAGKIRSVGPKFVVLETDANNFAVPLDGIKKMQLLELPIRVHVAAENGKTPNQVKLGMAYLRKGVTWIPEYTLTVLNDDEAELTLRGTFVNEAEDLVHCNVDFVVGVPHFTHTEYLAPIAVGQIIRTIGAAVAPQQIQTQIMNRAALVSNLNNGVAGDMDIVAQPVPVAGGDLDKTIGNLPRLDAAGATDYTVYTKKDLTVRRGEKAIVTLFKHKIKYSHVYHWSTSSPMEHSLLLQNSTDTAWTTGPCLAVSKGSPLSEDILKYVPKGAAGEMPITAAVNIAQERTESETERKLKAHQPSDNVYFDLVMLKGELKIRNFEKQPAVIYITAPVLGKPTEASDDGKITVDTTNLQLLERSGTIKWKITVPPGETKTLKYAYERYVRSQ